LALRTELFSSVVLLISPSCQYKPCRRVSSIRRTRSAAFLTPEQGDTLRERSRSLPCVRTSCVMHAHGYELSPSFVNQTAHESRNSMATACSSCVPRRASTASWRLSLVGHRA
jgi:hypothetical protein